MRQIAAAAALAVAAGAQAEPATYTIDPTHTFVVFEVLHLGTSTQRGRFDRKEGSVQIDRAARTGRAEITIDLGSVNSGVEPLDKRLRDTDIFDTANHPTATFVGDRFVFDGDKVAEVGGMLTLAGKTNPVTLKAANFNCYQSPLFKREVCGGDFEATLRRSQWGIVYGLPAIAPDEVRLRVQIEAIKQ